MITTRTLLLPILLMLALHAHAQTWRWGIRGGGSSDGANTSPLEAVSDIATDRNGNVYITGTVESGGAPTMGGSTNYLPTYGSKDIVVSSFTCTGAHRWSKVIGGVSGDFAGSIGTDSLGHVYVTGRCQPSTVTGQEIHFSTDSTQPLTVVKTMFLVQYDTLGRFQWLRQPTPDTASLSSSGQYALSFDMQVEPNGDVYWLVQLPGGLVSGGGGWAAINNNTYILKYNAQGVMVDHIQPQMITAQAYVQNFRLARSKTGMFVLSGNLDFRFPPITIGGSPINHVMFMAAFNSRGTYLWKKENALTTQSTRVFSRPVIDPLGNVYYSGVCTKGDVFNGYTFSNSMSSIGYNVPFIGKMDSTGKHLWIHNAGGKAGSSFNCLVLNSQNEIWLSGATASMYWTPSMFIQSQMNAGNSVYVTRFNAAGNILSLDSVKGAFGGESLATCSALDRNGNLVIGGNFNISMNVTPSTTLLTSGGASDLFVAKYGFPCNCTAQPTSNFTSAITSGRTIRFTYSGSTASVDSLVWTWGDRQRQTVKSGFTTALNYTYTTPGTYTACANVYGSCGTASFCKTTTVGNAAEIAALSLADNIKVYPNPADRYLKIDGAEGASIALINTLGQPVLQQRLDSQNVQVDLGSLPAGIYLLQVRDAAGNTGVVRVSKL